MAEESTAKRRLITIAALLGLVAVQTLVAIIYKLAQKNGKYEFSTASALTMAEFIKIWLSFGLHVKATGWKDARTEMVSNMKKAPYFQLLLLALSYFVNNHLNFYLFLWADPVSITVMKSGASFITAILSWIVLAKFISKVQWSAILLQVAGLCLLQYDPCRNSTTLQLNGYFIMFISVTIASANGIWNERLLKSYDCSLNIQNMILYMGGTVFNFLLFLSNSSNMGFFQGYDFPAVVIVFLNAVIGLTITVIYKYTNAIAKTFCSAVATVVLFIVNATLFNLPASLNSVLSCIVVFVATYLYTQGAVAAPSPAAQADTKNSKGEYDKLPTSELEVEDPPVPQSRLARVFGQVTPRRIGALLFTAVIIASLVISFQTAMNAQVAVPSTNDTIVVPDTPTAVPVAMPVAMPVAVAETPRTAATAMLRQTSLAGVVVPPSASFFDDILVILHFNTARYNHLPILLEQYGKVFKNFIVCGPDPHPLIDVVCNKAQGGHGMYSCIADIMETYSPEHTNVVGYMSYHFDLFVNYWNLVGYDKNRTWITYTGTRDNEGPFSLAQHMDGNPTGWGWWGSHWGMRTVKQVMPLIPEQYKEAMNKTYGYPDAFYRGMGDFYYIPKRLRSEYISLARLFVSHEVFLEIAIPTIPIMMELPSTPQHLSGVFDWSGHNFKDFWHPERQFGHPFHFHVDGMYDYFREAMAHGYSVKSPTATGN